MTKKRARNVMTFGDVAMNELAYLAREMAATMERLDGLRKRLSAEVRRVHKKLNAVDIIDEEREIS